MRKIVALLFIVIPFALQAQNLRTCDDETYRSVLDGLVKRGQANYERSFRQGIKEAADSLELALNVRLAESELQTDMQKYYSARLLRLRANWHYENGNYEETSLDSCENYLNKAMDIYDSTDLFDMQLNCKPLLHQEMAELYYRRGDYRNALEHVELAFNAYKEYVEDGLNEDEQLIYDRLQTQLAICQARLSKENSDKALYNKALKNIEIQLTKFPRNSYEYYEALRKKGKILMLGCSANCAGQALPLYKEYLRFRKADALRTLASMTAEERQDYWMRIRPFVTDCYQLENADPAFLYDVTLFAKGLLLQLNRLSGQDKANEAALASLKYEWKHIQAKLPKDACAIEFVQYEKGGEQKMAALVLKKTGTPQWVEMMSPKEFFGYKNKLYGRTVEERIYTESSSPMKMMQLKNGLFNDSTLYSQIWNERLGKLVKDCRKVYFAPDGYLHQIAIEYMIPEEWNAAHFYRLTSTRRLLDEGRLRNDAAMIIGGVNYQIASSASDSSGVNDQAAYNNLKNRPDRLFKYLDSSAKECDSIFTVRSCQRDTLIIGSNVSESMFRELCNKYPIINISTHGLFCSATIPQGTELKPCLTDESLSQSILAMAGVNGALDNEQFNPVVYDGILSAYEMTSMDMSNVDLVVISACQTGMGYVTSDGVFGIQRGLKNAGVGSIIASLWSVSDDATSQLMIRFHQNLCNGLSLHNAFILARASLMEKDDANTADLRRSFSNGRLAGVSRHTDDGMYDEPYYYNAFILIDALE